MSEQTMSGEVTFYKIKSSKQTVVAIFKYYSVNVVESSQNSHCSFDLYTTNL